MGIIKDFRSLLSLFTTLPTGRGDIVEAARLFHLIPLVGLLESLIISLAVSLLIFFKADVFLIGSIYVLLHILVTGAIHLDGFSDYSDAIGSRTCGEKAIEILKDPRKGSFAVIAIVANLIVSLGAMASLSKITSETFLGSFIELFPVIALIYVSSAESMYLTLALSPIEPYEGLAKTFSLNTRTKSRYSNYLLYLLLVSILITIAFFTLKDIFAGVLISIAGIISAFLVSRDATNRIGFANGDVAGFTFEVNRMLSLIIATLVLS